MKKFIIEYWLVEIQGGQGDDVWERERTFTAVDITDALEQGKGWADDESGHVTAISWSKTEIVPKQKQPHPNQNESFI